MCILKVSRDVANDQLNRTFNETIIVAWLCFKTIIVAWLCFKTVIVAWLCFKTINVAWLCVKQLL